jgi:hypothetical protein
MNRRIQLEIPLEQTTRPCRGRVPRKRMTRARWWFTQMRLAVEQASDWEPSRMGEQVDLQGIGGRSEIARVS